MSELTIHRGSHHIGGCCTEITCGGERILIDLGANLPDSDAPIRDDELLAKVFDGRPAAGLLFTHPHGDHYGLYKKVPQNVPTYIGPMAREILRILVHRLDYISDEKGLPAVERMQTYQGRKRYERVSTYPGTPPRGGSLCPGCLHVLHPDGGKENSFYWRLSGAWHCWRRRTVLGSGKGADSRRC